MKIKKKTKRYNFKEHKLELCFTVNVDEFTDEQVNHFISVFASRVGIPPNLLIPERPSRR